MLTLLKSGLLSAAMIIFVFVILKLTISLALRSQLRFESRYNQSLFYILDKIRIVIGLNPQQEQLQQFKSIAQAFLQFEHQEDEQFIKCMNEVDALTYHEIQALRQIDAALEKNIRPDQEDMLVLFTEVTHSLQQKYLQYEKQQTSGLREEVQMIQQLKLEQKL